MLAPRLDRLPLVEFFDLAPYSTNVARHLFHGSVQFVDCAQEPVKNVFRQEAFFRRVKIILGLQKRHGICINRSG